MWGNRQHERGFTLIEIMVVIIILGILASYVAVRLTGQTEEARRTQAVIQIEGLETALELYKLDNGSYPSTEQGLQALVEPPTTGVLPRKWREGGYLKKGKVPKDPWKNDYIYLSPGLHGDFDIISYGDDGEPGGEGKNKDVNNWELE
jgi:general secretion pathway protein G